MDDFKKTNMAGRGIATFFANGGWGIAAIGLLLAVTGFMLGHVPGGGVADTTSVALSGRLAAAGPGVVVGLFGLFSVLVAAQTRAAMDTADMTRALLKLARTERKALPKKLSADPAPSARVTAPLSEDYEPQIHDDIPAMPVNLRAKIVAPVSIAPQGLENEKRQDVSRTEPLLKPVPKSSPKSKPHPIFSAKPPR